MKPQRKPSGQNKLPSCNFYPCVYPENMSIPERIQASGKTDKEIAAALGISTPAAWRWRKGLTSPNIVNIRPLAKALGCKPLELIPEEGG